jgi:hypothetical protein
MRQGPHELFTFLEMARSENWFDRQNVQPAKSAPRNRRYSQPPVRREAPSRIHPDQRCVIAKAANATAALLTHEPP